MKLFTTVSSERGKPVTKSGNEYLNIEIKGENRQVIATMTFRLEKTDDGKGQSVIAQFLPSGKRASDTEVWEIFLDKPKTPLKKCNNHFGYCAEHKTRHEPKTARECKHEWDYWYDEKGEIQHHIMTHCKKCKVVRGN